ncbi:MAG TPA: tripartite tricarboxylate transporter substrate binding protein [Burkholderiales bacterium]|nr:tripartite tricarboxylate transporter substrate binding protein [Burkholderiales bacterium]
MKPLSSLMFGLSALLIAGSLAAQTIYPEKPVRVIVGFPPGSSPDVAARLVGHKLAEALGKPVVIENITGASGIIATERVAKAVPDGHTLAFASSGFAVNPGLYANLPFDPVKDFAPISQVAVSSNILLVHNAVPAKSVQELLALARAQPGILTFASGGSGSSSGLAGVLFKSTAGIDIREVPYKGVVAAIPDLLGGRVTMAFIPMATGLPLVREGKLRALAVTSLKRSPTFPELPTIAESGYPGFEATNWHGFLAPAGTPATIVRRLHLETVKALALPDLRAKLAELGLEVIGNSPDEFAAAIRSEIPKWAKVIKESGIKPE